MMNYETDFMKLYESLLSINEDTILSEAGKHEHGKYKKAFLNLINGLYYDSNANTFVGNQDNVHNTKVKVGGTLQDMIKYVNDTDPANPKVPENTIDAKTDTVEPLSDEQKISLVNRRLKSGQRAIATKKVVDDSGNEVNYYSVYELTPSILHHVNGEHDDNAFVKGYRYEDTVDHKQKYTSVFVSGNSTLTNYILITAKTNKAATYAHMLIHILGMIAGAIGVNNAEITNIAKAFDNQLTPETTFYFIEDINSMKVNDSIHTLADLIVAKPAWGSCC